MIVIYTHQYVSQRAKTRTKQRSISNYAADLLLEYGADRPAGAGCFLDEEAPRAQERRAGGIGGNAGQARSCREGSEGGRGLFEGINADGNDGRRRLPAPTQAGGAGREAAAYELGSGVVPV
jgi:hypothetical protein